MLLFKNYSYSDVLNENFSLIYNEFDNLNELTKNNVFTAFDKLENWIEESYA